MTAQPPVLLDAHGTPLRRMRADAGLQGGLTAGDTFHQDLAHWMPSLMPADSQYGQGRDLSIARVRDLAANNGWTASAVRRDSDNVIGPNLRLSATPDYRALGLHKEWAVTFATAVEPAWRGYSEDPDRFCDAARLSTMGQIFEVAYKHYRRDDGALAVLLWLPDRGGRFATTVQLVDPDRLSNPGGLPDTDRMRRGIETDAFGAPVAYHIRKRHPGEGLFGGFASAFEWERVTAFHSFGRRRVVHAFEKDRAEQSRGVSGLASVVHRIKMEGRYGEVELQAAVLNAILCAFIESQTDPESVAMMLEEGKVGTFQEARKSFYDTRKVTLGGLRIPALFTGDRIGFHTAQRPAGNFAEFEAAVLRHIAAGFGITYEQLSGDWSKVNYSSARAGLMEIWKSFTARRIRFCADFPSQIYIAWLEEFVARTPSLLPSGAPPFAAAKAAYGACGWLAPGRGWIDPEKEARSAMVRMLAGLSTLQQEAADQGADWEAILDQLAVEIARMPEGVLHPAQKEFLQIVGPGAVKAARAGEDGEQGEDGDA